MHKFIFLDVLVFTLNNTFSFDNFVIFSTCSSASLRDLSASTFILSISFSLLSKSAIWSVKDTFYFWYGMVWYGTVWYGMVRYGAVWYGMATSLLFASAFLPALSTSVLPPGIEIYFKNTILAYNNVYCHFYRKFCQLFGLNYCKNTVP